MVLPPRLQRTKVAQDIELGAAKRARLDIKYPCAEIFAFSSASFGIGQVLSCTTVLYAATAALWCWRSRRKPAAENCVYFSCLFCRRSTNPFWRPSKPSPTSNSSPPIGVGLPRQHGERSCNEGRRCEALLSSFLFISRKLGNPALTWHKLTCAKHLDHSGCSSAVRWALWADSFEPGAPTHLLSLLLFLSLACP
ncbi:hypothetical protein GQ53DRAFT_551327 [Thozetella sp. PMI_491]|nr:hypothetical protein GQ53DRAFT_551327 [Thozetella sp. PMI_491]